MEALFFGDRAVWFTVPALIGTVFFLIRLLLLTVVGHGDLHADSGADFDLDHGDPGGAFKALSVSAISAFLMGFGWGGLGAYRGWGFPALLSVPVGLVSGGVMMWVLGRLFRWIVGFQSSGTLDISATLDEEGTVYAGIPAARSGKGVVRLVIGNRLRYYDAVTDGEAIATNAPVRVVDLNDDNSITVVPAARGALNP